MSEIKIREAAKDDLPEIIRILADDTLGSQREDYRLPLPQCYIDAFNNISKDENSILLVVCTDGKVIGSMQITFTQYLSHRGSLRATFENIRIAQDFRGSGIGTRLLKHAIDIAKNKNCSIVQLTTNKSRTDAHGFYQRLGFRASHEGMKLSLEQYNNGSEN
ncbi:MAG TPA: GNAT family N-acetyltransferase [Candidatus Monoglobus merdigallinarum]|uniref:GNAT family N-acetyltransferase n=1 Tax=Candidatus Monoglobus merdigallinarum TaxID=2838698 RepID=A0A9D1TM47_9FIRM|nr:GNAT family N-acetyltransferase [Candidatus Monoglobus merdigallinarum]